MSATEEQPAGTDEQMSELQRLLAEATPLPWAVHHDGPRPRHNRIVTEWIHPQLKTPAAIVNLAEGITAPDDPTPFRAVVISPADAALIVAAVNALPALLSGLAAARADTRQQAENAIRIISSSCSKHQAEVISLDEFIAAGGAECRFCLQSEVESLRRAAQGDEQLRAENEKLRSALLTLQSKYLSQDGYDVRCTACAALTIGREAIKHEPHCPFAALVSMASGPGCVACSWYGDKVYKYCKQCESASGASALPAPQQSARVHKHFDGEVFYWCTGADCAPPPQEGAATDETTQM